MKKTIRVAFCFLLIFCSYVPCLKAWDCTNLVECWDKCDIFTFEESKEIAFIHLNHMLNERWRGCALLRFYIYG